MAEISIETYAGKLNQVGYTAFLSAMRQARGDRHRHVDVGHLLFHILSNQASDISVTLAAQRLDRGRALKDLDRWLAGLDRNVTEHPGISEALGDAINHAWTYATLLFGEVQIRTGHILVALLSDPALKRILIRCSSVFESLSADHLARESRTLWAQSDEEQLRPMDGSGLQTAKEGDAPGRSSGSTALGRFSTDLTEVARSGKMDRVVGRDAEIAGIIDVLLRRRQNNPILTGEAGVGKTAVVEGFAQRLAANDVPPALRGQRLVMLDVGAMQAGASMRGEFEQRLRSVIDEIQSSPTPIILFIDEAHTLVGAGGAAGTGDAANLLKPALARGTLRTIGATTWAEYRTYFEKDPALARRFQPVAVDEPSPERCATMLRGILGPMEAHHKVRISDEALVAAVNLSARYIPARQLPDKAVSLLDTACARVAVSQTSTPARIRDMTESIAALEAEVAGKRASRELGETKEDRITEAEAQIAEIRARLERTQATYAREKDLVERILRLRRERSLGAPANGKDVAETVAAPTMEAPALVVEGAGAADSAVVERPEIAEPVAEPLGAASEDVSALLADLESGDPDERMIYPHVDVQAVASVIADWTGVPVGRMVADELQAVLELSDHLRKRVIGQDEGLRAIAKRIEASRVGLSNPNKPIGVFMLCGPSGVGKTETALALAEQLYGGEQNVITIAMSEFQEAHTVSLLKGAPPGYVGYGEGGRLTEAVRRKPYSVVLLDEIEKAHPDVHELFFQVFDKGWMEDGSGRPINFRNTIILLTSNVGTEVIMDLAQEGRGPAPDMDTLVDELKPHLLRVFPPALIGRMVVVPYVPLSREVLGGIVRLKLGQVGSRLRSAQGARLLYDDAVVEAIVDRCRDPDSGGRMIDNVISSTILPDLSRQILGRLVQSQTTEEARISVEGEGFAYTFS